MIIMFIRAGLASLLTRHDSRFYWSHNFQNCPLRDYDIKFGFLPLSGVLKHAYFSACYVLRIKLCIPVDRLN
jgi:hypothetical protein